MDEESTQWSPYIQDKVTAVQRLPASTPDLKQAKKEAAENLRLETQLMTAGMMKETISYLSLHPQAGEEELIEELTNADIFTNAEDVRQYVHQLQFQKRRIQVAIQSMKDHGIHESLFADQIFLRLQSVNNEVPALPQNPVYLDTSYPAALILKVSPEDYKKLYKGSSAGYYRKFQQLHLDTEKEMWVPIIIVSTEEIQGHEKMHAELRNMQAALQSMEGQKHKSVWGNVSRNNSNMAALRKPLREIQSLKELKESGNFELAISYALGRAKEEILAECNGSLKQQVEIMLDRKFGYDYFVTHLQLKENSDTHDALWQEYTDRLQGLSSKLVDLNTKYRASPRRALAGRLEILAYIFAQIPIESWNDQIHIYEKEYAEHIHFLKKFDEGTRSILTNDVSLTDEEAVLRDQFDDLASDYLDVLSDEPYIPMYITINNFSTKLEQLRAQALQTEAAQLIHILRQVDIIWKQVCDTADSTGANIDDAICIHSQLLAGVKEKNRLSPLEVVSLKMHLEEIMVRLRSS